MTFARRAFFAGPEMAYISTGAFSGDRVYTHLRVQGHLLKGLDFSFFLFTSSDEILNPAAQTASSGCSVIIAARMDEIKACVLDYVRKAEQHVDRRSSSRFCTIW